VCASARKGREEIFRKDHIKGLDKGDLVFIIFGCGDMGKKLNIINAEIWENNAEI
jgi:hypothetical protein